MRKHIFIIFCEEHYNPLGIVRSLGENGIYPVLVVIKSLQRVVSCSKYIKKVYSVDSMEEGLDVIKKNYSDLPDKPFILTSDDMITSFLDLNYEALYQKFYFYNAGHTGRITEFMDKERILNLAEAHGLHVLKSMMVDKGVIPKEIKYPIVTKAAMPNVDGWKSDSIVCYNEEDLRNAYQKIKSEKVLLQHYLDKKNEICLDGVSVNEGKDVMFAISSTYNYILANSYSHDMMVKSSENAILEEPLRNMFTEIGFEGIFSAEFLVDQNDNVFFMEINFRNSGWSYAATCAGMNLPLIWSEGMIQGFLPKNCKKKIKEPFRAIAEFPDFSVRVKTKQISCISWIKNVMKCKCLFYWNWKDPIPFFGHLFRRRS